MSKYHVNDLTGEAGLCRAIQGKCPFGSLDEHFETPGLARAAYESRQSGSFLRRSRGFARRVLAIGGMAVAVVSLASCATSIGLDEAGEVVTPADDPASVSQPIEATQSPEVVPESEGPGLIEKADQWVQDHPIRTPSTEEIERWVEDKTRELENMVEPSVPLTYEEDGIYFQGKSLKPTADEISEAQRILENIVVQPANDDGSYKGNRENLFGRGFQTGVVGAVEHRDVPNAQFRNDSPQARVVSGEFRDPWTGDVVQVIGGEQADADIDHVVSLKEFYISETGSTTPEQRIEYANNLDNLVYTASSVNRSKNDKDAADWIPSYEPSQCVFAVKVIEIKGNYNLSMDTAEKAAIQNIMDTKCVG